MWAIRSKHHWKLARLSSFVNWRILASFCKGNVVSTFINGISIQTKMSTVSTKVMSIWFSLMFLFQAKWSLLMLMHCYHDLIFLTLNKIWLQLDPALMDPPLTEFRLKWMQILSPFNLFLLIFYIGFNKILPKTDKIYKRDSTVFYADTKPITKLKWAMLMLM